MDLLMTDEQQGERREKLLQLARREPDWPDTWTCMCPCGTDLQGGLDQFHRHWLVVHRERG